MIFKGFVLLLIASVAGLWLHGAWKKSSTGTAAAAILFIPTPVVHIDTPSLATTNGPATLHGVALMDTSSGPPAIPYIQYESDGRTATKQLVFTDSRGCYPSAGDLPCAPTTSGYAYPVLASGQPITVTGYIRENRFFVENIQAGV